MSLTDRLNYFTGFFTTARDWTEEQTYHIEKRKLHNCRMHTSGVIRNETNEFRVEAAGGLDIRVVQGAAIDGSGNDLYLSEPLVKTINPASMTLPATVYIGVKFRENKTHYAQNMEIPQYSGYTRVTETVDILVDTAKPDNATVLELARIQFMEGATVITNPIDPQNPGPNEIDRRYVVWAGATGLIPERLPLETRDQIIALMMRIRKDFAALDLRFPVPSSGDARHAALTAEMLARTDSLSESSIPGILSSMGSIHADVGQEIALKYTPVIQTMEFDTYIRKVVALLHGVQTGDTLDGLLNLLNEVGIAARELSELVLQLPIADAGPDFDRKTDGDKVTVSLNASHSKAFGGRTIKKYHWRFPDIYAMPTADSGLDHTVFTATENETVVLDASHSKAYGGKGIVKYYWTLKNE